VKETLKSTGVLIKKVQASTAGANPNPVPTILEYNADLVITDRFAILRVIRIACKLLCAPVKRTQATAKSASPNHLFIIYEYGSNIIVTQAFLIVFIKAVPGKLIYRRFKKYQSIIFRTNPEVAILIRSNSSKKVTGKAVLVLWVCTVMKKLIQVPVVPVQAPASCRYPDIAFGIFHYIIDEIITDARFIFCFILVDDKLITIIPVQTISCAKPHKAPAILECAEDMIL
jgi:hypothetical protein